MTISEAKVLYETTRTWPDDFVNQIINGECVTTLRHIPDNSIDITVTSCPYDNMRTYNGYVFDYQATANELYRVTKPFGVVVWVVGDATIDGSETLTSFRHALYFRDVAGFNVHDTMIYEKNGASFPARRDGNRYTQLFEYMFVFSKGKPGTANLICDKPNRWAGTRNFGTPSHRTRDGKLIKSKKEHKLVPEFSPRNNIWRYATGKGYSSTDAEAFSHPATFPEKLVEDHLRTWTNPGDDIIVLDCFSGSGTTCKVAKQMGFKYIGIEISEEYCELSRNRLNRAEPPGVPVKASPFLVEAEDEMEASSGFFGLEDLFSDFDDNGSGHLARPGAISLLSGPLEQKGGE